MPGFTIDQHPQKQKIVQQILAGRSVRAIAASVVPRVSFNVIQRYKVCVVKPILVKAEAGNLIPIGPPARENKTVPLSGDQHAIQTVQESIQAAPVLSLFRTELENLRCRITRGLDKAEANPELFPSLAPLLNQGHKNLEILGRATGELESAAGSGVSIQIVCPWAPDKDRMPRVSFASDDGQGQFDAANVFEDVKTAPKT